MNNYDWLDKDFLGKFAQEGIDICEPIEGFAKYPSGLKHCVDDLIKNHKKLKEENERLKKAIKAINTSDDYIFSEKVHNYINSIEADRTFICPECIRKKEIAQKALSEGAEEQKK